MSSVGKGKLFEKKCLGFLSSVFDEVEHLSESKKATFDFKCISDNKEYFVEAKYNKNNIKPILRKSQEGADFVVTNDGEELVLIPRDEFDEKVIISTKDSILIKVKTETYTRLGKRKGFNGCVSFDDVIGYLMDREEGNNA